MVVGEGGDDLSLFLAGMVGLRLWVGYDTTSGLNTERKWCDICCKLVAVHGEGRGGKGG